MARLNIYVPDELAEQARAAELNISALSQEALRAALRGRSTRRWLDSLPVDGGPTSSAIDRALEETRQELFGA